MRLNILSCSKLDEKGVTTTIAHKRCTLIDRRDNDTVAVLSRRETDGLFMTNMLPATEMTAVNIAAVLANDDKANNKNVSIKSGDHLRHQRLVHANNRVIKTMVQSNKYGIVETDKLSTQNCL